MKKLSLFLLWILLVPLVLASHEPGHVDEATTVPYYDDPYNSYDYVNTLSPEDLLSAIERGDINSNNLNLVADDRLASALEQDLQDGDPTILTQLSGQDLSRALRSDLSLMTNGQVVDHFESRISSDKTFLNDINEVKNEALRQTWFSF